MNKLMIAAVAATLLGSTSLALANDSGRKLYDTQNDFWAQQYATVQGSSIRNAQASLTDNGRQAVKPVTNAERQLFVNATPNGLGN